MLFLIFIHQSYWGSIQEFPTGFSYPALSEEVTSAGNTKIIWSSEHGDAYGQVLDPIYKTVAYAAYQDEFVYKCFTLIDAYETREST